MTPEILEVTFKGNKREHYFNPKDIKVKPGDYVIVEADKGIDLGVVNKVGRLVALAEISGEPKKLIRKAGVEDIKQLEENRKKENMAFIVGREKIKVHNLNMKLVDVEYQYDQNKLTFYFTSDKRVDFRMLVKDLAAKYRTRIELRQIGVRDEARRLGGLGVCGKTLCCTSFMKEFEPISTQYAKEQNLPLNPSKLTGVCGRLKCCLLYEKCFYEDCTCKFPPVESSVLTKRGKAVVEKVDIFKEQVCIRYDQADESETLSLEEFHKVLVNPRAENPGNRKTAH
jgi:cell fate regulator YaaT (PSP1 superfamily)